MYMCRKQDWSDWTKGMSGGAGIIVKEGIRCEEMTGKIGYVCVVKIGRIDIKFE